MTPIVGDLIQGAVEIIGKFIPDADKRVEAQLELAKLADGAQAREDELLRGQIEVNKVEASSSNIFVAGWRPFIGWTCGVSLGYTWIVAPIAKPLFHLATLPVIDPGQIYPIVLAMLGIGGMRTVEKLQGVASGQLGASPLSTGPVAKVSSSIASKIGNWFK